MMSVPYFERFSYDLIILQTDNLPKELFIAWRRFSGLGEEQIQQELALYFHHDGENLVRLKTSPAVDFREKQAGFSEKKAHAGFIAFLKQHFPAGWHRVPEDLTYVYRHLIRHLLAANLMGEARAILKNPLWMRARIKATHLSELLEDFDKVPMDNRSDVIEALTLSAYALLKDPDQIFSQLSSRLNVAKVGIHPLSPPDEPFPFRPIQPILTQPGGPQVLTLWGHTGEIYDLARFADQRRVITASMDGTLRIWDLALGEEIVCLSGHSDGVLGVAVFPNQNYVISGSEDQTLILWDSKTGQAIRRFSGHEDVVEKVDIFPDNLRFCSASADGTVKTWHIQQENALTSFKADDISVQDIRIMPDGIHCMIACMDTIKLWNTQTETLTRTFRYHKEAVNGMDLSEDEKFLFSASDDGCMKKWFCSDGEVAGFFNGHHLGVNDVAVMPGGQSVITAGEDGSLISWNPEPDAGRVGHSEKVFYGHSAGVNRVLPLDSKHFISGSSDHSCKLWRLDSPQQTAKKVFGSIFDLAPLTDGSFLIADFDKKLPIWKPDTGTVACLGDVFGYTTAVAVSNDGAYAASGASDSNITIWDLQTREEIQTLRGHTGSISKVVFTADGNLLSAAHDHSIRLWNLENGSCLNCFEGHDDWVTDIAMLPDNIHFASGSLDGSIKIWDLRSNRISLEGHAGGVQCLTVLAERKHIISGGNDSCIRVWDMNSGILLKTFRGHASPVMGCAIDPGEKKLITASEGYTLEIWDLAQHSLIGTFTGEASTNAVCFSPDGQMILAGDAYGRIFVFEANQAE